MNISGVFQREKRHPNQMYHPMHHSVANYWTEAFQKREMKHNFTDELFLNNIHMIPDPLKKNLADSLFNTESGKKPEKMYNQNENVEQSVPKAPKQTTLGGIGSFFSGVMSVLTNVMFRSRETNYYDCFDVDSQAQAWQQAKADVQDKNGQTSGRRNNDAAPNPNASPEMNLDSRQAVTGCERKLNEVLHLLTPKQTSSPVWVRKRPKKVFVEPGSVEENFQDAFSPEDFCSLQNDSFIEYYSPMQYQCEELCETAAQKTKLNMAPVEKTKLNMAPVEKTEIIKDTPKTILENKKDETKQNNNEMEQKMQLGKDYVPKENDNMPTHQQKMPDKATLNMEHQEMEIKTDETEKSVPESPSIKNQLVSSCEDKLSRLKALLQEKRLKCRTSVKCEPESKTLPNIEAKETKMADKRFKNPNRRCAKRTKSKTKNRIEDDLIFANEISIGTPPSAENSPMQHTVSFGDYFDEVSGRFRTTSTGSDDSFQIVFNEYPTGRLRKSSDCDSEDSFIVFEDSPDNCFVSNDVFDSDSESEMSDSGFDVTFQLAHSLTRTVSNLADDSLYVGEDEVDCAMVSPGANVTVKPFAVETPEDFVSKTLEDSKKNTGLILDEKKKQLRKSQPSKQVRFSSDPPKVHVMRVWAFAARQARAGHWERFAVDRERFKRRIADADMALSWVLKPQHRSRVMFQRFMPWWNQLKRKELAERKAKEEEEKRRTEEDKRKAEEEKQKAEEERRREEEKTKEEVKSVQEKQNLEDTTPQKQNNEDSKSANNVNLNEQGNVSEQINDTSNLGDLNNKIGSGKENLQQLKYIPLEGNQETISQSIIESKTNIRPKDNEVVNTQNGSVQVTVTEDSNNIFLITDNGKISNLIIDDALAKKLQDLEADDSNRKLIRS